MPSTFTRLCTAYTNLHSSIHRESFLTKCLDLQLLPKGFRLQFNLAHKPTCDKVYDDIRQVLNKASSDILKIVRDDVSLSVKNNTCIFENIWKDDDTTLNDYEQVIACKSSFIDKQAAAQHRKLTVLINESSENQVNSTIVNDGSFKLCAFNFVNGKRRNRQRVRKRRCKKSSTKRNRKVHKKSSFVPSEDDKKKFDPIVLAENIQLSKDQIDICRLPDCFAPTPKEPIDVSDQLVGTHAWAERLRWHRFYNKETEGNVINSETNIKENIFEDVPFEKKPWYQPTTRSAPREDHALELFIDTCMNDFLNPKNRRKIRDNLTSGQRKALNELKQLPITHGAACRFADKEGVTVITDLKEDDEKIKSFLHDENQYDILPSDPSKSIGSKVKKWAKRWKTNGQIDDDVATYVSNTEKSHPAKCKPLVKTHKPKPYPYRLLLAGSGTPVQPISKFVQIAISHLTNFLPYQVIDTKEFLQKIDKINQKFSPLPASARLVICDVVSLYPSVDNTMGVPAVEKALVEHPSKLQVSKECIVQALDLALTNNVCSYTDADGTTTVAAPNKGTAMGPCHACDYVDVFMGELDNKLVEDAPVPLLSSTLPLEERENHSSCDWSRFRDDGFVILPDESDIPVFENHLQNLHPDIHWTVSSGREAEYLDVKLKISEDGSIKTDVFSKNCHSYLPPSSCHNPTVFKGLAVGMGTRLRMLCSDDQILEERLVEYAKHLAVSGWDYDVALTDLRKGASKDRDTVLHGARKNKNRKKKIAWVTTYDPRVPSKSSIIKKNLHILYQNEENKNIFKKGVIIGADKKRKNLGDIYKPSVPKRIIQNGPQEEPGFFPCGKCDTCAHSRRVKELVSPRDGRRWFIKQHLTCRTPQVIYLLFCKIHNEYYTGSTKNLRSRWAQHKSDIKLKREKKCRLTQHVLRVQHPRDVDVPFLEIFAVEAVEREEDFLERELYWQANFGTVFKGFGLNFRKDLNTVLKRRIEF